MSFRKVSKNFDYCLDKDGHMVSVSVIEFQRELKTDNDIPTK